MNAQESGARDSVAPHPWRAAAIGFVLLYCPLLVLVFATISFSAEDSARQYAERIANRPPAPMPPLPVVHFVEWPDIAMQRDPFQSQANSTTPAPSAPAALDIAGDTPTLRLVATYQEAGEPYVIGRGAAGELARFGVGDKVDGDEIERIDPNRVIFKSGEKQREVEILRAER